jgi:hypothetical protein
MVFYKAKYILSALGMCAMLFLATGCMEFLSKLPQSNHVEEGKYIEGVWTGYVLTNDTITGKPRPLAGALVIVNQDTVMTDNNGKYEVNVSFQPISAKVNVSPYYRIYDAWAFYNVLYPGYLLATSMYEDTNSIKFLINEKIATKPTLKDIGDGDTLWLEPSNTANLWGRWWEKEGKDTVVVFDFKREFYTNGSAYYSHSSDKLKPNTFGSESRYRAPYNPCGLLTYIKKDTGDSLYFGSFSKTFELRDGWWPSCSPPTYRLLGSKVEYNITNEFIMSTKWNGWLYATQTATLTHKYIREYPTDSQIVQEYKIILVRTNVVKD